jgi:hypothetical protein
MHCDLDSMAHVCKTVLHLQRQLANLTMFWIFFSSQLELVLDNRVCDLAL